jgi:hypothetical protein
MTIYGWNTVPVNVAMPISGGTVNSAPFSVPMDAFSLAIHTPTSLGGATVKLQSLDHDTDQVTEVWRDVSCFNLADGTFTALDGIPENAVTTLPITATGGGVLRFVASATQAASPSTIKVDFLCGR